MSAVSGLQIPSPSLSNGKLTALLFMLHSHWSQCCLSTIAEPIGKQSCCAASTCISLLAEAAAHDSVLALILFVHFTFQLSDSTCSAVCLPVCLSACLPACLAACLSVRLTQHQTAATLCVCTPILTAVNMSKALPVAHITWRLPCPCCADVIVGISVAVIVVVFCLQRLGSSRIGFLYSPILITWFLVNATIGVYNIIKWQPDVFKAISPHYAVRYFQSGSKGAWLSLGGCVLCITGSEAMFADMGHFSHKSILVCCLRLQHFC